MSFMFLVELKKKLKSSLADLRLEDVDGNKVAPDIYINSLPTTSNFEGSGNTGVHRPYVVIRLKDGEDTGTSGSILNVCFLCGVLTSGGFEDGEADLFHLVFRVRKLLLEDPTVGAFALEYPLTWQVGTDEKRSQPHPYHKGAVRSKWRGPDPEYINQEVRNG